MPLLDKTRATVHGRREIRRIKPAAVTGIVRRRRIVTTGKVTLGIE